MTHRTFLFDTKSLAIARQQEGAPTSRVRGDEAPGAILDAIGSEGSSRMLAAPSKSKIRRPSSPGAKRAQGTDPARSTTAGSMKGRARHGLPRLAADPRAKQSPKTGVTLTNRHHRGKDPRSTAPGPFPRHTHGGRPWLGLLELAQHRVAGE